MKNFLSYPLKMGGFKPQYFGKFEEFLSLKKVMIIVQE